MLLQPSQTTNAHDLSIALARLEYLENKRLDHIRVVSEYQKTELGRIKHREAQRKYREKLKNS
tara:strand:+ start:3157 stop:3345 length:189 start_codon:yes stop_codon:yes gene_type:complete